MPTTLEISSAAFGFFSIVKCITERGLTFRDDENVGWPRNFFQAKFQKKKIRCFCWPILQPFHKSRIVIMLHH